MAFQKHTTRSRAKGTLVRSNEPGHLFAEPERRGEEIYLKTKRKGRGRTEQAHFC